MPSFRDNPLPLLIALEEQAARLGHAVEFVLLDDGGGDLEAASGLAARFTDFRAPGLFLRLERNEGRASGRNRLARSARGRHFLFIDSDLLPDHPDFLQQWLSVAADDAPIAYGGFKVDGARASPETALHRAMASRSDCLPASERALAPAKYVFANNLLVRQDVFAAEPFDESYTGWGWEDVEWGVRAGRRWPIRHIDNPVQNGRLDTVDGLLRKYEEAAPNFARILAAHPDVVATFPTLRVARMMKHAPLRAIWAPLLKRVSRNPAAPLRLRSLAMRTYRASLYAQVV